MAKTPKRRAYEYDHHYGLALGGKTGSKAGRGRASSAATSSRPAKARSTKRSAKKR
jgi:hypothetical protein